MAGRSANFVKPQGKQESIMVKYDVCVLGLGPVGTVSGACYAKQGFRVMGIDINPARINALMEGKPPFVEPGIGELLKEVCASGHFRASQDFAESVSNADIIMIAVGTPTPKDAPDLSQLDSVCAQIGAALREKRSGEPVIVVRSTVRRERSAAGLPALSKTLPG
jgi:GDP-mannose 6-dehydrogenase